MCRFFTQSSPSIKIERQRSEGLTYPEKIEDYFKIVNPKVEENIKQLYENDIKSQGYILHNLPNTKSADNQNNTQGINSHVLDFANKLTTEQLAYYRKEQNSEMPLDETRKMYNNYIEDGKRIIAQIDSRDEEKLQDRLHSGNKASRKLFEKYTGIKLGNTNKETQKAISDFCKTKTETQENDTSKEFNTIEFAKLIGNKIDFRENVKNKDIYSLFEKTYNQK